jgi:hypothetical protein
MTYREGVAADVVRADREIRDLQVLNAMDIQSLIQDTMLDNAVALSRAHRACAQAVPSSLRVSLDPFLNMSNCSNISKLIDDYKRASTYHLPCCT